MLTAAPPFRILLVEDETPLREALAAYLRREGITVLEAADGEEGWRLYRTQKPDLVVLDRKLPGLTGEELCRRIKGFAPVPVLMATSLVREEEALAAFDLGADDYIRKPYSVRELTARIKVRLRDLPSGREGGEALRKREDPLTGLVLDPHSRTAALPQGPLALTRHEFDLAFLMSGSPDRVFSRRELIGKIWPEDTGVSERTVDAHIKNLRAKLRDRPPALATVWGLGYRWAP